MNIRKLIFRTKGRIKQSAVLSRAAGFVRTRRCRRLCKKYARLPLDGRKVLFYRSGGGYADNPRAVAEYLHAHHPEIRLVWAVGSARFTDTVPSYVKTVLFESDEYFRELATAGAWVCSTTLPLGTVKRPGQLYVQTWHGDKFLKKIGKDSAADIGSYKWRRASGMFCESEICDYYVTGCEWFVPIAASALDYTGDFLRCGMPRNDCLVHLDPARREAIREALGVDPETRVLIYAPTFRDYEKSGGVVRSDIDLERILDALENKYGCRWICLMRAHHGLQLTTGTDRSGDARFRDVTQYPDMADLLMASDMLISDYSSCGADFAITGKMVLMYQDDIDRYTSEGRTLYFSREESPYFTASDMDEALAIIGRVTEEEIRANSKAILDFYDSFETGHACETVCETILDALEKIPKA